MHEGCETAELTFGMHVEGVAKKSTAILGKVLVLVEKMRVCRDHAAGEIEVHIPLNRMIKSCRAVEAAGCFQDLVGGRVSLAWLVILLTLTRTVMVDLLC